MRVGSRLASGAAWAMALAVSAWSSHSGAATYCEDIEHNWIVVGEARYFNDQVAYANSYWDNGAELALDAYVGGADSSATDLRYYIYVHGAELDSSECNVGSFALDLETSDFDTGGCPSGNTVTIGVDYTVNSCNAGNSGNVWAGKTIGLTGVDYVRYNRATVLADSGTDAGDAQASDDGCFTLLDDTACTLMDF